MNRDMSAKSSDIAIIGMSGRFPQANDLAQFWQNLTEAKEAVTFYTPDDLRSAGINPAILSKPNYVGAGLSLENIDLFDAQFFGYNAREAEALDPQHRLFLECSFHALEDAGYDPHSYPGSIGVFGGCAMSTYMLQVTQNPKFMETVGYLQVLFGNEKDYLPTHVSYKLNLRGPSFAVQSACSTGLLAAVLACQSLRDGQCDMALAGASCVRVPDVTGYGYQYVPGGIYSPDGHCRVFDKDANGTIFGSGVGVVVLKRLSEALEHDHIYAVIKGSAVNNDGSFKIGYTAPSLEGQADVIARAHRDAGIHPETITYIEAHGTATRIGDPIEIGALTQAFQTKKRGFCAVGSVKSNVGHLDPAAGIASLIKTALCLEHKTIPASLHLQTLNPDIDFANSPFYVNSELAEWKTDQLPRRAGVSAFGIGGTNVHVVLEEAPAVEYVESYRPAHLFVLSARSKQALDNATEGAFEHFRNNLNAGAVDAAFTSQVGRRAFVHRRAVVVRDARDAAAALKMRDPKRLMVGKPLPSPARVAFLFPGQGSQYAGMGERVYQVEPVFREAVDECAELLSPHLGLDLRAILFAGGDPERAAETMRQTEITQPALFTIEYSLAKLWMEWGIRPTAMMGHSIGEFVAACLAGVMPLGAALKLVAERGRLMQSAPRGSMLAVPLAEDDLLPLMDSRLDLAAVNETGQCVVSGPTVAVEEFEAILASHRIEGVHRLHTSHAFHSAMMDSIIPSFEELVRSIELKPPRVPFVSNVTGHWITDAEATDSSYWARHLRRTVRFADGLLRLTQQHNVLLEAGPGNTLSSLAKRQIGSTAGILVRHSLRHPYEKEDEYECLLQALGQLWISGANVDWNTFHAHDRRRRTQLPLYPFDRERYWVDPPDARTSRGPVKWKKPDIADWFYGAGWQKATLPASAGEPVKQWLIFTDAGGIGSALAQSLTADGCEAVTVLNSDRFARTGPAQFEIDGKEPRHYRRMLRELAENEFMPEGIVHLWSANSAAAVDGSFDDRQAIGFFSVLYLAQALIKSDVSASIRIVVVSTGLHGIRGDERLCPDNATILGACKTIPQEYPNLQCRSIDVVLAAGERPEGLIETLKAEAASGALERVVAYRNGERLVQVFEPVRLEPVIGKLPVLRERGVYIITGGLGNIGLALATFLVREVHAKVALVSRTALPPRQLWPRFLEERDEDDPVVSKIRSVQRIEALGDDVMVLPVDIADAGQVRQMAAEIRAGLGPVNGVIHGAGTIAPEAFCGVDQANPRLCEKHFRPKIRGLLVLSKALEKEDEIDFWFVISSLSSVLAGLGFAGYAASNLYLDTFVAERNQAGREPWFSLNWDNWEFPRPLPAEYQDQPPLLLPDPAIYPGEGVETFRRLLGSGKWRQLTVSTTDLRVRLDQWIGRQSTDDPETDGSHARPELSTEYVAPQNDLEKKIAALWCDVFGLERVGVHDNFFTELGGNSLMAAQLVSRLRSLLALEIPVRRLFELPTIVQLAADLAAMEARQENRIAIPELKAVVRESPQLTAKTRS
jgi:acyl transferase domain-containing protein/acyl carrier protein